MAKAFYPLELQRRTRQALRINASTQFFSTTSNLPDDASFTLMGWCRQAVDRNSYSGLFEFRDAGANYIYFGSDVDGTSLGIFTETGGIYSVGNITPGQPFAWALTSSGTASGATIGYIRLPNANVWTSGATTGARAAFTPVTLQIGSDQFTEWWNGAFWDLKCWNRVLTPAELLAESKSSRVLNSTQLKFAWSLEGLSNLRDSSLNRNNPVLAGAPVSEWIGNWLPPTEKRFYSLGADAGGVTGTLATTNQNDTFSAAGTTTVVGTLARTNANDTLAASGTTTVIGTLARTNQNDTLAASGSVGSPVSGTVDATNANDTLAASGTTTVLGTLARTNQNDTSAASGTTTVLGTLARTNQDDTLSASGSVGSAVSGSVNATNANDTLAAAGTTTIVGAVNRTNQNDTSTSAGTTTVLGTLARTNANDTCSATGSAGSPPVSSFAWRWLGLWMHKLGF